MSRAGQAEQGLRPLHVLTITPFYPKIGNESAGCFIAEPIAELKKMAVQCSVLAVEPFYRAMPVKSGNAPDANWYRYPSLPSGIGLASAGKGLYFRLRRAVAQLHARLHIDVIHAHAALPCGHAACLLHRELNIPYVVTVHGLDAFSSRQVSGWAGKWCERVSGEAFRGAARVIGVSRRVCDEVESGTASCATVVVHNGADPSRFTPGADPGRPILLTVGNVIPTKGHALVVEALAALRPQFPGIAWEVVGDGGELDSIRELAHKLGVLESIQFRGRIGREEVAEAYRRCTVFVLPSWYEGLGCVYLEAMASGKVAIGCRGQGIEEIIRHGENGWLIVPGGLEELIGSLKLLLEDVMLRARIGAAARETIVRSFTMQHQAERLKAIYEEVAG